MNLYLVRGREGLEGFVGQWWATLNEANADVAELTRLYPDDGPYSVLEFVPAAGLHASEELVQRLADALYQEALFDMEGVSRPERAEVADGRLSIYGIVKRDGKWEKVK